MLKGRNSKAGSVARISAVELEAAILKALHQHFVADDGDDLVTPKNLIGRNVTRVLVGSTNVKLTLKPTADGMPSEVDIPWSKPQKRERPHIEEANEDMARAPNPQLVQAVVRAHTWARLLSDGTHKSIESLAQSVDVHPKIIRNGIRMAFLAPTITKAILEGEQPPSLGLKDFIGAVPLSWSEQRRASKLE